MTASGDQEAWMSDEELIFYHSPKTRSSCVLALLEEREQPVGDGLQLNAYGRKCYDAGREQAEADFQEAVLDAAVEEAKVDVPDGLVEARARELLDRMLHRLSHQGISREMYLQISGQSEEELVAESSEEAERSLKREAVLAAIVEAEGIEPADGDILDALQGPALQEKTSPQKLRNRLEKAGRLDDLKDDLAQRAALDFIVENAASDSGS